MNTPTINSRNGSNAPDLLSQALNDYSNGQRILACHGDDLLYCGEERVWLVWDSRRWKRDPFAAQNLAEKALLQFMEQAKRSKSKKREKVLRFATSSLDKGRTDAALAKVATQRNVPTNSFDRSPRLLNFRNGTLDLETGELRQHDPAQRITRLVEHDYVAEATCPLFRKFIDRIMNGNAAMIEYLQCALGYSMTGETRERAIFVAHGGGCNGKSTLLDLMRDLIGEYSSKVMIESLLQYGTGTSTNALADLAGLRGVRFVSTSEGEKGQRFGGTLKRITQGSNGAIKTARKYENHITFRESHKLWIDTNHLPEVASGDDALWSRLHPIHFAVTIPKSEVDPQLGDKLRAESEGILAWLAEGARLWYANGLALPDSVVKGREAWREESEFTFLCMPVINKPGPKPSCDCGVCETCFNRERQQKWRERQSTVN